VVFLYYL